MIAGFSILSLLLILLAGVGAGFVGYAVGASSLVSYPALLAFGIPPVLANASNTVGVVGTGIGGVMGAHRELKGQTLRVITYVAIGAIGGIIGAFLLLELDPKVFEFAAPALILFSSLIIAVNPRGRMQAKQAAVDAAAQLNHISAAEQATVTEPIAEQRKAEDRAAQLSIDQPVQPMNKDSWWVWIGVWAVAIYSGYFGAGAGTCALAVLDAAKIGPFHKINALKTLIGTGANITASVVFIVRGAVDWPAAIMLCIGCFIGGYIAPPITRRIPANIMRAAAVIAGIVLTVDLSLKTY
ncbi:sulfite exporter TauE/SafE family protein [Bifidobacterium felsineum]|uniref:sulfite exporter TauE/SafE family protein n=1 Tax=Bifidobacterium felsineum TaxID=2045440 RepID=UPI001BDC267C|nr:sulfite exporter TauE/SafE family protein [Bifidobacterium felsineum]MBT1164284.1 sulfite exporter TauE/SafE family protein [Bifidobacterium felsineum]